jgi:hypothetical protein
MSLQDWDHLQAKRDRDLAGREWHPYLRRAILLLLALFALAALLNAFGQRATTSGASSNLASLQVTAPERLRGGLYFQGRFRFSSPTGIAKPALLLDPGWMEAMTLNSTEPQASNEGIRAGRLEFDFPSLAPGKQFTFWTEWQVNPTNIGSHDQDVSLYDGDHLLAHVDRSLFVFP